MRIKEKYPFRSLRNEFSREGFSVVEEVFSETELKLIESEISKISQNEDSIMSSKDLYAVRRFLLTVPKLKGLIFTDDLKKLLCSVGSEDYFLTKAIYFDKPKESNWFVSYHQDLSISVVEKANVEEYNNWTKKRGQLGVIPPVEILENIITLRIHLDDTNIENGALRVIPKSHLKGIIRKETSNFKEEVICNVNRGGVMLMKPLTMHASGRSKGKSNRRVIHLEFSNKNLQKPLEWRERLSVL